MPGIVLYNRLQKEFSAGQGDQTKDNQILIPTFMNVTTLFESRQTRAYTAFQVTSLKNV